MSTAATATALANRSIRTIRAELEFLADTSIISPSALTQFLALLPTEQSSRCPPTPAAGPVPKSTTPAVQHPTFTLPPQHQQQGIPTPRASEISYPLPIAHVAPAPGPTVIAHADALWAFTPAQPGDLGFGVGDRIEIIEKVKEEWWKGRVAGSGAVGLFPSSYVREIPMQQKPLLPSLPPRAGSALGYGPGGNMMTDIAHGGGGGSASTTVFEQQQMEEEKKKTGVLGKNGEKFGKKLGNAAIFGAGATIGGNIVNSIF